MKEKTKVINLMKELSKEKAALCKEIKPVVKEAMRLHNKLDLAPMTELGMQWEGWGTALKPCDNTNSPWQEQYEMAKRKRDFRAFHIARCELRGRTREQIEKPSDENKPDEKAIESYKLNWSMELEEAICADKEGLADCRSGCPIRTCSGRISS